MKASELVEKLNALIAEHGDLDCTFDDDAGALYYISPKVTVEAGEITFRWDTLPSSE